MSKFKAEEARNLVKGLNVCTGRRFTANTQHTQLWYANNITGKENDHLAGYVIFISFWYPLLCCLVHLRELTPVAEDLPLMFVAESGAGWSEIRRK